MTSGFLAGAVMMTFFAPAARCLAAASRLVKRPVDSKTTSTPRSFHGSCAGSLQRQHLELVAVDGDACRPWPRRFACRLPSTESYFSRCASVCGVGQVVDGDEVDVLVAERRAHDVAADAAEPVDANLDWPCDVLLERSTNDVSCQISEVNALAAVRCYLERYSLGRAPLYTLAHRRSVVVLSPYFLYQAVRYKKYIGSLAPAARATCRSRFNLDGDESIWIHAVSVGEALTARALAADLQARYPRLRLFLSTTTMAGQQVARTQPPGRRRASSTSRSTGPSSSAARCDLVQPRLFIMMETEIWPNLLRACRARGVKTVLVNGRISSRSYPRYRLVRPFFRRVLADVDRFCMQSDESARRHRRHRRRPGARHRHRQPEVRLARVAGAAAHGRPRERVLRFFRLAPHRAGDRRRQHDARARRRRCSRAFARVRRAHPTALLDPRAAPARAVRRGRALARDAGFASCGAPSCRSTPSRAPTSSSSTRSASWRSSIQVATAVFVGGSLVDHGGHNILEPAVFGKPIVFGPHMQNFEEIAEAFLASRRRSRSPTPPSSTTRAASGSSATRSSARGSARRRARWSRPTAAPRPRRSTSIADLLPPPGGRGVVRAVQACLGARACCPQNRPSGDRRRQVAERLSRHAGSVDIGRRLRPGCGRRSSASATSRRRPRQDARSSRLLARLLDRARRAAGDPDAAATRAAGRRTASSS